MLFERITASGVGLAIGSISEGHIVNNITFRDCFMHRTWKGIYMKFRGGDASIGARISNVLYENIYIEEPEQFAIWIGPAQQYFDGCSIFWPYLGNCTVDENFIYENITLRNITVVNPKFKFGHGVILGHENTPMQNITFDGVRVVGAVDHDHDRYLRCEGVEDGLALGDTYPVPPCFHDETDKTKRKS